MNDDELKKNWEEQNFHLFRIRMALTTLALIGALGLIQLTALFIVYVMALQ